MIRKVPKEYAGAIFKIPHRWWRNFPQNFRENHYVNHIFRCHIRPQQIDKNNSNLRNLIVHQTPHIFLLSGVGSAEIGILLRLMSLWHVAICDNALCIWQCSAATETNLGSKCRRTTLISHWIFWSIVAKAEYVPLGLPSPQPPWNLCTV